MTTVPSPAPPTVRVPFAGERSGRWPVTVAQGNVCDWMAWDTHAAVFSLFADLPAGSTVAAVADAVGVLISRHEGLRTTFATGSTAGRAQQVDQTGQLDLVVLELGDEARRRTYVTEPLRAFDHEREYPLRVAVCLAHGAPARVVFEFSHLAADLYAGTIVLAEFAALLAAPDRPAAVPRGWQPADQADHERTPAVAARLAKAHDYWRTQIQNLPPCLLSVPAHTSGPAEFQMAALRSAPMSVALREIEARTRVWPATTIVATIATLLSVWTGNDRFAVDVLYSNRALPRMADYVGTVAQAALVPFARTSASFHQTLRATQVAVLTGYKFAHFDGGVVAGLVESIGTRRGCERHRDLVINDMSSTGGEAFEAREEADPVAAGDATQTATGLPTTATDPIRLTILRTRPIVTLGLSHDLRYLSGEDALALLISLERLLTLAARGDVDLDRLGDVLDLAPARRGPDWTRLASGWIDLGGCGRLFREATGDRAARIFVEDGELVGYAAPADPRTDPAQLHAAMMAALGGRHGAVAPDRYVLCARAPSRPRRHTDWQAQLAREPARAAGPGR